MCTKYCNCDPSGAAGGWNQLTQEDIGGAGEDFRTVGSFLFTGKITTYDGCIESAKAPVADAITKVVDADEAKFYAFAKTFREQTNF